MIVAPGPRRPRRHARGCGPAACILALSLAACLPSADAEGPPPDHAELAALYQADQAERAGEIDWNVVAANDRRRRARVQELIAADSLRTANDHFHAAMIFQHGGDSTAYRKAWLLAEEATRLDPTHASARWLTAAAFDRYLLSIGEPQHYGTQFLIYDDVWYLQPIDTTAVTDAARRDRGTRTLAEIEAFLEEQNGAPGGLNVAPDSVLRALGGG